MSKLFEPYSVGSVTFRNRLVRSATQERLSDPDGGVSADQLEIYERLAAGGVGLILTGHAYVSHPLGRAHLRQNAFYDDRTLDGYKKLVEVVHRHGAKVFLQLAHAGGRTSQEITDGLMPVAPSDTHDAEGRQTARALTIGEIQRLLEDYEAAALRAKRAGFDGVQVHMAHGYLLSQFLSPFTNNRDDEYGGSAERRVRLLCEAAYRVKAAVGRHYPVFAKLNTTDGVADDRHLSPDDAVYAAKMIAEHGVDAIETSGGSGAETRLVMARPGILRPEQEAYFAPAAKRIRAAVNIPVILVGGVRSTAVMETLLADGTADMFSFCRPLIREPDLVNRLAAGQPRASCVSCNGCFLTDWIQCTYKGPAPE